MDAFHASVIHGDPSAVNDQQVGTKMAALYRRELGPGESMTLKLRLTDMEPAGGMEGNSSSNSPNGGGMNGPVQAERAGRVPGATDFGVGFDVLFARAEKKEDEG